MDSEMSHVREGDAVVARKSRGRPQLYHCYGSHGRKKVRIGIDENIKIKMEVKVD